MWILFSRTYMLVNLSVYYENVRLGDKSGETA